MYGDSSHVHFRSSFIGDDFLVALICPLFSRHFIIDGHPEHVSSALVCCPLTLSSYCKLSSGIWSYQNPVMFYKVKWFCTFWPHSQITFFFGGFCHWSCHDEWAQYYWSSKQWKQMRSNLGRFTFIAANSTFEIKIVHNSLLSSVYLYLSIWWCCKCLCVWSSTPGKVKKFIYQFGVLMRHVVEQWLAWQPAV